MTPYIAKSSLVAYVHYLSIMICFGALLFERISLKNSLDKVKIISILIADVLYGIAGIALLVSGILRVKYYGQGGEFYTHNTIFWIKIILFICVGLLSLYPTYKYITWAIPISKGKLPEVGLGLISRLKTIINIELIGFSLIPLFATLMARGVGVPF